MKKGASILRDPASRRVKALMMLEFKLKNNATSDTVAKEFGCSVSTVNRMLSQSKRAELIAGLEDKVLSELMPAAHKAIVDALQDGDASSIEKAKIGIELFKGALPGFGKKANGPSSDGNELQRYLDQFRNGEGLLEGEVASGAVEGQPLRALPPAEAQDAAPGAVASDSDVTFGPSDAPERSEDLGFGVDEGDVGDSQDGAVS